jgi:hypothetical protein
MNLEELPHSKVRKKRCLGRMAREVGSSREGETWKPKGLRVP